MAGALFWLSGNLDGLVKNAIESYGSSMTQARVSVGSVKLSPTDGRGSVKAFSVGNPPGFKTAYALKVASVEVEIDVASVTQDVVLVRRIAIEAPDVIYEKGDTLTNFDALSNHIVKAVNTNADPSRPSKKLIVELLTIRHAQAQASAAFMNGKTGSVALPDITLKNLGRAKGGISPGELGQEVVSALKTKLSGVASFDRLMKSGGDALNQVGAGIKGLFK
ncbi:hypothetical protein [Rhodoferax sp.]|uniref:hypothetical protein n=1 Tax=Rhodoferax sp. TaxID=50421 RepID=UPI00261C4AD8|nr:hypothetical protein [Rhodoferax sp.]MDD2917880.1 hypothetical protein [Rhodoferax sp.]